jgi:hypothetical protein
VRDPGQGSEEEMTDYIVAWSMVSFLALVAILLLGRDD